MDKEEFNLEQLDKEYDETMAWNPPSAVPPVNQRVILNGLLKNKGADKSG